MSEPENAGSEFAPLTSALRDLAPAPGGLSRDALLFQAGKASVLPAHRWLWQTTAGGFALLATFFAVMLGTQQPQERIVFRDRPVEVRVEVPVRMEQPTAPQQRTSPLPAIVTVRSDEETQAADARRMAGLRRDVLRWGVEMLPEPRATVNSVNTPRESELREWVRPTPGTFASPYAFPFRPPIRIGGDD